MMTYADAGRLIDVPMVAFLLIFKTRRLLNIHKLINVPIKKCTLHIHLVQLDVVGTSIG